MVSVRRSYFTLLELLMVLFLISFGVLLTGVKVKEMYHEQRFFSEAQKVLSHLTMAQDLMLITDADVYFKFAPDPQDRDKLQFWLEVEKPFEEAWAHFIERKVNLEAIRSYEFIDHRERDYHRHDLALLFSSGAMSQGELTLYEGTKQNAGQKDNRFYSIELPGYPKSLKGEASKDDHQRRPTYDRHQMEKGRNLYPEDVYKELYEDPNKETKQTE